MLSRFSFRKIVTGFLVFAIIATGALWVLGQERENIVNLPVHPTQTAIDLATWQEIASEQNLTQRTAQSIAEEILKTNRYGPQATEQGLSIEINPRTALPAMLANMSRLSQGPFVGISAEELNLSREDSFEIRQAYFANLQTVINRTFGSLAGGPSIETALAELGKQNPSDLNKIIRRKDNAILILHAMQVPASLASLHKETIDFFARTNILLKAIAANETDPLRAYLAIQALPLLSDNAQTLERRFSAASERERIAARSLQNLPGFNPAHAVFPTIEIGPPAVMDFTQNLLTNVFAWIADDIKRNILDRINTQVLNHIQGAIGSIEDCPPYLRPIFDAAGRLPGEQGAQIRDLCPRFITDWQRFLFAQASEAGIQFRREVEALVGRNISADTLYFLAQIGNSPDGELGYELDDLLIDEQICNPNASALERMHCLHNNLFIQTHNLRTGSMRLAQLRETAEKAGLAKAEAGKGYLGAKAPREGGAAALREPCPPGDIDPETGQCRRQTIITTPGATEAEKLARAQFAEIERIVNVDNFFAIIMDLIRTHISSLIDQGFDGLLGMVSPRLPTAAEEEENIRNIERGFEPRMNQSVISASPSIILAGEQSEIAWNIPGAHSCTGSGGWIGARNFSGRETVSPTSTATYTLTCSFLRGIQQRNPRIETFTFSTEIIVVSPAGQDEIDPVIFINASPRAIGPITMGATATSSTIAWHTMRATNCIASGDWSGTRATPSGTEIVNPTQTSTYTLTCEGETRNDAGVIVPTTRSASVTVTVREEE